MIAAATTFPRRPVPVAGESIYGFERRFAACTRYEALVRFGRQPGCRRSYRVVHRQSLPGSLRWPASAITI